MTRTVLLTAIVLAISGCTVIKINKDSTTIEHKPGAEMDLTNRTCRRAGEQSAVIISTVNKNPDLPPGTGTQVTKFRCTSAGR